MSPDDQNRIDDSAPIPYWEVIPASTPESAQPDEGAGEEYDGDEGGDDYSSPDPEEEAPRKRTIFKKRTRKPSFPLAVIVNAFRILLIMVLCAGLSGVGVVIGIAKAYVDTAPDLDLAAIDEQAQTSFIYDSNYNLITEYKGTENRIVVSISTMPMNLRNAFVAVEDARFYTHNGIDVKRIAGAFVSNFMTGSMQGGSTITQQLIKNTLLSSEQSYKRKIQEAYLAIQMETPANDPSDERTDAEKRLEKKQAILESYLNTIYLGENYYGVQVAAQGYFGKKLGDLTLRECAMLAGITNNPSYYNPRRNFYTRESETTDYAALTNQRTDYVLRCMYENQFITRQEYEEALRQDTATVLKDPPTGGDDMYAYAHYVEYAVSEIVDILLEINGRENTKENRAEMENRFRTGGYHVRLAVDPSIQQTVQETLANWAKYPTLRDPSDKVYRSRNADGTYTEIPEPQAACAVLDYRTGEIKAIVGSREEPTVRKTLNRATDMKMPVGSSIKPIAVYAPALDMGASPASVAYNMPLPITGWRDAKGNDSWPTNYGGGGYVGPETLRTAMARSHNTAAAYTLLSRVGVERSVDYLHRMGIDDDHIDRTPFGLSLGSSGITPLQMTVAYGVLANGGTYQEPISVLGISDSYGNVVWDGHRNQEKWPVFAPSTSYMIVDMLQTVVKSGTGTSAKIKGQTVGGKTGTNSDSRGVFFAGMTGYYASALWIGHDNYKALSSKSTGSGAAAPLWQAYMSKIHANLPDKKILDGSPASYNLVQVETCVVSGQLATDECRNDTMGFGTVTDYWAVGTQPTTTCQMHVQESVCAESHMPASEYCPYVITEGVVQIPEGHPLYQFIGTSYQGVLEQYLGIGTAASGQVCPIHNGYGWIDEPRSTSLDQLINDAWRLIEEAENIMSGVEPGSSWFQETNQAAIWLEILITQENPNQSDILNAMAVLQQLLRTHDY